MKSFLYSHKRVFQRQQIIMRSKVLSQNPLSACCFVLKFCHFSEKFFLKTRSRATTLSLENGDTCDETDRERERTNASSRRGEGGGKEQPVDVLWKRRFRRRFVRSSKSNNHRGDV